MKTFLRHIYLLQWKNAKLKQRNKVRTVFEVIAPLFSFLILIAVRQSQNFYQQSPDCQFKPVALASKGPLEALRSFCFLGVCRQGNQAFGSDAALLNDTEYRNLSILLRFTNKVLANPLVNNLIGALKTLPSNWSDPSQTKQILFGSLFKDNSTKLFDGVNSTAEQRADAYATTLPYPRRWDLSVGIAARLLLSMAISSTDGVPAVVCSAGSAASGQGWAAIRAACGQPKFKENLKSQFSLDAALNQMSSTEPDKYTVSVDVKDLFDLRALFNELTTLRNNGTLNVLSAIIADFRSLTGGISAGGSGGVEEVVGLLNSVSKLFCGTGQTIFTKYADRLAQQVGNDTAPPVVPLATVAPGTNVTANDSLLPPENFCFSRRYQKSVFGSLTSMISSVGFGGITNLIFGVIPFYPDEPQTRQFLIKVNRTLQDMSQLSYLAENFTQTDSPYIKDFIANSSQMDAVRDLLSRCYNLFGNSSAGPTCNSLQQFLAPDPDIEPPVGSNSTGPSNWRDLLRTADSLMTQLYYATACFRLNKLIGFNSQESLENYTSVLLDEFGTYKSLQKPLLVASLLFDKNSSGFVKYRLRYPESAVDDTRDFKVLDKTFKPGPRGNFPNDFKYFTSFFLHIQELLEHGIQAAITGVDAPLQSYLSLFPSACFQQDNFANVMGGFLPMIMTISWIYNVSLLVNAIVYEKESRLKEMMKIMGLSDGVHWLSWFMTSFVIMVIASALMTLLLKTGQLIVYSDPLLLFFFILSFVVSTICEAFFISIFFSNSSVAAAFAGVIYFAGYVPYGVVDSFSDSMSQSQYLLSSLIPQLAFGIGCKFVGSWELASIGLQTSNFMDSPLSTGQFTFNQAVMMMWVDSAIFMILTWYLEKVFPGAYGVPKPWYFPFTPSFWCGSNRKLQVDADGASAASSGRPSPLSSNSSLEKPDSVEPASVGVEMNGRSAEHFEEEPKHLTVGIAVRNLTKIYEPGLFACKRNAKPFIAVDDLSYNFYEGQVTSFLGHNGAGKSTTMSVLTGLYTPTSGTAYIAGHDIRTEMDQIRKQLGLCPQHNVLFDSLTVEDHIYFYGMLKGLSKAEVEPQIDEFIADVGLQKKRYEMSKNLSGGMKRKLSVAMAFVGGSKIIVLDEPTAGVDPHARRAIWDVLTKFRRDRTIILTTHHMDEADILGDRICIINKGKLVCSGSPIFLKKVFGEGYTLTLVKESSGCDIDAVLDLAKSVVPEASIGECTSSEINLKLPYNSVPKLATLFAELDKNLAELRVASYGIEDSSLEEIFLAVTGCNAESSEEQPTDDTVVSVRPSQRDSVRRRQLRRAMLGDQGTADSGISDNSDELPINSSTECIFPSGTADELVATVGPALPPSKFPQQTLRQTRHPLWQQVKSLWLKRLHVVRRSKIGFIAEFVLPAFFVLLALSLLQIVPKDGDSPAMELAPWYMLGDPERSQLKDLSLFRSQSLSAYPDNSTLTSMSSRVMLHINDTDFLGTRCIRGDIFSNEKFPCRTQRKGAKWSPEPSKLPRNTSWCKCSYKDYPYSAKCVDWPTPARKSLMSADVLDSMQGYNLTNYIQSSVMQYYKRRFGGYTLFVNDTRPVNLDADSANLQTQQLLRNIEKLTDANVTQGFISGLLSLLEKSRQPEKLTALVNQIWFDNRGYVSGPAYLNTLTNAIMRALANSSLGEPNQIGVSGWTHPITSRATYVKNVLNANTFVSAMTVVSIIFALSFIPASFVLFLISERTTNAKHLQFVSGINPILYWVVNHAWNLFNYLVPLTIVILLFVAFKNYEFVGSETIGPFLLTMILFGFASAPLMYPFSWVMSVPSKAFTMLSCLNLGVGFTTTMSVTIVRMIGEDNKDQTMINTADTLKNVFLLLPHFCLGQALMELNIYYQISVRLGELIKQTGASAADLNRYVSGFQVYNSAWDATQRYLLCMAAHSIVYFILVLLIEYNCCCKQGLVSSQLSRIFYRAEFERALQQPDPTEVDEDVRAEAEKVEGGKEGCETLHLLELRRLMKIFSTSSGPKAAVKGISLGVKSHECFGFLGVNGAGKTTTFKMLTGDIVPTSGDAFVGGFSILTEALEVHKQLGYCPQFDALLPLLTGRETLQLYARIRGVKESDIDSLVETIAKRVGIEPHLDKTTQEYSGGNKRKLSCGIAFIGNPPIVFLDEPTAGMDPGARRFLWRCIQSMVKAGSCVIITTHSMEDCQALCHRLTIMVNGRLQCIGSPQHLKNKFGQGFTVFLRVRQLNGRSNSAASGADAAGMSDGQLEKAHDAFVSEFPEAVLSENHAAMLQYQLKQTVPLRLIFAHLQTLKDKGLVLDYSVNQTTLDQVFINFAKNQTETSEEVKRSSRGLLKRLKNFVGKGSGKVSQSASKLKDSGEVFNSDEQSKLGKRSGGPGSQYKTFGPHAGGQEAADQAAVAVSSRHDGNPYYAPDCHQNASFRDEPAGEADLALGSGRRWVNFADDSAA